MNMIKTMTKTFTLALAMLAAPIAAQAAGAGNIYAIFPLDKDGNVNPPTTTLVGGDEARFVVRLQKNETGGNPLRLKHIGLGQYDVDWYSRRPKIGIYVSGEFRLAELESWAPLASGGGEICYTDFVFSYRVKPGDFERPIRLADRNGKMITDASESTEIYFDFLHDSKYAPAWAIDDSVEGGAAGTPANLWFTMEYGKFADPGDGSMDYVENYDFTLCKFFVQTVDFDENDESSDFWRTVHEGSTQTGGAQPSLHIDGMPTNAVTLYVWSTDESAVKVVGEKKPIHLTSGDETTEFQVATIKVVAGKTDYPFDIEGVTKGKTAQLVLSAFPDFKYKTVGFAPGAGPRLDDFTTVTVSCTEPLPASVKIVPAQTRVTATSTSWQSKVTELAVSFSEPFGEDVEVEIVPGFSKAGSPLPWADYIRFSAKADEDVTLQAEPVANPKVLIPAGKKVPTQFVGGAAIADGKIYVYALRADAFSDGSQAKLAFMVTTDNEQAKKGSAAGGIDDWDVVQSSLTVVAQDPVIVKPEEGTAMKAFAGNPCTFSITVSDDYANMTNAYKVFVWKDTTDGAGFTELPDEYVPDPKTGVLYKKGSKELPSATYTLKTDPYDTAIKVKSVVSENESAERHVSVTVGAQKGYTIEIADEVSEFDEGTFTQLKITFDELVPDDCYAFLKPVGEATNVVTECSWLAGDPEAEGQWIRAGETELTFDEFQIMDGDASKAGSSWKFDVVLLKTKAWSDNPDDQYGKFKAKNTVKYNVHNVTPVVTGVTPDGKPAKRVKDSGATIKGAWPKSETLKHTFAIAVDEPGLWDRLIDKDGKRFETVVTFYNEDEGDTEYYPEEAPDDGILYGDPETNTCTRVFESAGHYRCEVMLKDKDMKDYDDDKTFIFYFDVVDNPSITVETETSYQETDVAEFGGSAKITVKLAINDCTFPMYLKLKVAPNNSSDNPGTFLLETNTTSCVWQGDDTYLVTIPKGKTEVVLPVQLMDGTRDSAITGFQITGEIPEELNKTSIVPGSDNQYPYQYYVWSDPNPFKVRNDAPVIEAVSPAPSTNVYKSAAGLADVTITWSAVTDVSPDYERKVQGGLMVSFTGGGGKWETNVTSYAEMLAVGEKGFTPNFSGKSGKQTVTMTIKDHDGGTAGPFSWDFEIEGSRTLEMIAHGPTSGFGASNGDRYSTKATGLGKGRTWAMSQSNITVDGWKSSVNCGLETRFTVYGYGYKVGDIDSGDPADLHYPGGRQTGYYADRDTPIDGSGKNLAKGSDKSLYYAYKGPLDAYGQEVDSFLYTWLQIAAGDDSKNSGALADGFLNGSISPEMVTDDPALRVADAGRVTTLASKQDNKDSNEGGYPISQVEAVFSIEKYWSDNLGDINQDGIPDAYVKKYGFGIFDENGQVTGDDLVKLDSYNQDAGETTATGGGDGSSAGDFLPATVGQTYEHFIPGLPTSWPTAGAKFTAKLEIRGYDDHLNDAPILAGMTGVKPERRYCEPDGTWCETNCTLSYLEYLAWTESGLPQDKWSPERPTDPTLTDTDGDGYTDGYEYYFWYKAHVGYLDADGTHRYLTGRMFDPRNPGQGRMLSSKLIALLMDPRSDLAPTEVLTSATDSRLYLQLTAQDAESRDSDNDGLPDLLEFAIGTNPFDFDTDGDGLPDGFEILLNGTDPLNAYTTKNICDAMRNYDGDAMAFTTPKLEEAVLPKPKDILPFWSFATVNDAFTGDSDGVQWYVSRTFSYTNFVCAAGVTGNVIRVGADYYYTTRDVAFTDDGRLATDLTALGDVWAITNAADPEVLALVPQLAEAEADYLRLAPARWPRGTQLGLIEKGDVTNYAVKASATVAMFGEEGLGGLNAAWLYGSDLVSTETQNTLKDVSGFGMLAMGRYLDVPGGVALAQLPTDTRQVALMHYLVYQEFGFDPRTAWNAHTPLGARWGDNADGETVENKIKVGNGYAAISTRTREFTAYDEFLLCSFWLENGAITDADVTASQANPWHKIWSKYTTNPQGPGEEWEKDNENFKGRTAEAGGGSSGGTSANANDTNGADSDGDGVPDGWELYVMSGPKVKEMLGGEKFNFAGPYNDSPYSNFGPFSPDAKSLSWTDVDGGDGDDLTELREFAGTDSCNWYSKPQEGNKDAFSTTIVRPDVDKKWLNKFFPTDPWDNDTDKDGIKDGSETKNWGWVGTTTMFKCANFIYGTPVDDNSTCIPGGGLNPLTVDTDGDGLPDLWEAQFAGSKIYDGFGAQPTKDDDGNVGNPLQGLCDGMDGTVFDAYTSPITVYQVMDDEGNLTNAVRWTVLSCAGHTGVGQVVDRDYDHDGLENWQEYMTGLMRCWRYDDPLSRWDAIPETAYYTEDGAFSAQRAADALFPDEPEATRLGRFWYETLVNVGGPYYNPHLQTDMSPANYMSRVTNPWDKAFTDVGTYYWMVDRIGETPIAELWGSALPLGDGMSPYPWKYACCSPLDADSDHDGLDDYYELFHGMNPLLGLSGVVLNSLGEDSMGESYGPCDLIYDAWWTSGAGALEAWAPTADSAQANFWQRDAGLKAKHDARFAKKGVTPPADGYDFEVYPWLNGLQQADPDGDDIRNLNESIQPRLSGSFYLHTDPTPLWMTDSSYSNSLVRLFFRLPTRSAKVELAGETFEYDGTTYRFKDFDGYMPAVPLVSPAQFAPFTVDQWQAEGDGYNWLFSFEENEGYDSDHDFRSDYEETQGTKRSATDPQDADSPRNRQAMYFPGWDPATGVGSVLQTMPEEIERHPLGGETTYPASQRLQTFTVEAWIMPESVEEPQTVLERAIWVGASQVADKEYMRKNFQIAIRGGKWRVKYDSNGTEATDTETGKTFEYVSPNDVTPNRWTHVAATFDGEKLTVFIDGVENAIQAHLAPATEASALALRNESARVGEFWFARRYGYHAFVIGASVKGSAALGEKGYEALDLSRGFGWNAYHEFFRGYVDEIRVWDGARASDDVINDYQARKRFDRTDALENRSLVYKSWLQGQSVPELLHHWTFDSVAGAENAVQAAKWPRGFGEGDGPTLSRPDGYQVDWWKRIVDAYGSVYAGKCDWITWIPDTVGHLPRFDGTTLDSAFWSDTYAGHTPGNYAFPLTAEPTTRWTQRISGAAGSSLIYRSTGMRHRLMNELWALNKGWFSDDNSKTNLESTLYKQYEFTARNLTCSGTDLLPLGGAFVKYVSTMWDGQGAASLSDQTGDDANANGLPTWWEKYADQNYRPSGTPPGMAIAWDTEVVRGEMTMTAGEAYLRDLADGMYVDANGKVVKGPTDYAQTSRSDGLIPDWWKDLFKISGADPLDDGDYDGLNNYHEYVASEVLPFSLRLDPLAARSDKQTLDYFQKVGKLYVGEMLTDHDMMEDSWERSLSDVRIADATIWDALKDGDEDGWTNFEENRYNAYKMSNLAQLPSHAVGNAEVLDAPVPSVKLMVRYNGAHFTSSTGGEGGGQGRMAESGAKDEGNTDTESISVSRSDIPNLIVKTYSDGVAQMADAEFSVKPGESVSGTVYLGGWEDRLVRGTMGPGNIDIGSVNLKFAQVPQSELYSWTDENGLHLSRPYAEFKAALERNPDIIQNIQDFEWRELEPGSSDRAVTVTRDALTQKGYIAVYGERVGTIDLTTGDFEFNMGAMMTLSPNYTFRDSVNEAWSYKEAIFKLIYSATVPSVQTKRFQVTLAKAAKGFIKGGRNTIVAFFDNDGNGEYTPGEPFGVLNDVEIGWSGRALEIELTDTSAVTPRVNLWDSSSDRATFTKAETLADLQATGQRFEPVAGTLPQTRVRVVRKFIDGMPADLLSAEGVVLDREFNGESRKCLHEGDFLAGGQLDVDWSGLYGDVVSWYGVQRMGCDVTNVTYLVVYDWDDVNGDSFDTNKVTKANTVTISRRFEQRRTVPTPYPERMVFNQARPTFAWKIENEDTWASWYGTTYTAFKVRVFDSTGANIIYESPITRLPAKDASGVYRWTAPICVGTTTPNGKAFANFANYKWDVALYNAKFRDDWLVRMYNGTLERGNPFCAPQSFRMNVTTEDTGSRQIAVRAVYAGPAKNLVGKVRVQAFETPDFTGDPLSETVIGGTNYAAMTNALDATKKEANTMLIGLSEGDYFIRAYVDTNGNGVRDSWESWGYLCERDRANKPGLFNPVIAVASFNPNTDDVRSIYIEDCDTNVNYFPDVWEAEQNGGVFNPAKTAPVSGDVELIGVNTNLTNVLMRQSTQVSRLMSALASPRGVAMMTGIAPADVDVAPDGGFEVKSEVDPETLTIIGLNVDAAQNRVLLKVGAETTANVDAVVANFLNVRVTKGAEVTVKVEKAASPNGPWTDAGVTGKVTVDRAGADIEVKLDGELPAQGFFRAKVEE